MICTSRGKFFSCTRLRYAFLRRRLWMSVTIHMKAQYQTAK